MSFQKIIGIMGPDFYIEVASNRADKRASVVRKQQKKHVPKLDKSKNVELIRVQVFAESLRVQLNKIQVTFPDLVTLDPFYKELLKIHLDYVLIEDALGGIRYVLEKINYFRTQTNQSIKRARVAETVNRYRQTFYGRCTSLLKKIRHELAYLEKTRKLLRTFPVVKTDIPTIVIAGFPNVGKTTLLAALTGSKPKIAAYPFTTQRLMIGYSKEYQFIDTPGLLDRLLSDRNAIELEGVLALKLLAEFIIFMIDATETCGYTLEEQLQLYKQVKKNFKVPILVVLNKSDIEVRKIPLKHYLLISAKEKKGVKEVLSHITTHLSSS